MSAGLARARGRRRLRWTALLAALALLALGAGLGLAAPEWPRPLARAESAADADEALVRSQRVCVVNGRDSAGDIGSSLVVRHRREGDRLWVSYFVYWSSERPWGDKPWLLSLAIDAFYSHFLFLFPGIRYAMYGPGDIEGVTVVYRSVGDHLEVIEGYGDDEYHRRVHLGPADLVGRDKHTVLMTTAWSHQLGTPGASRLAERADVSQRCFAGKELVPMTPDIAERFRLGSASDPRRARYAWL